ncbi:hypothetical protein MTP99_003512 [Tenebrio molitor]|nr:hypothetical protein MTP99_003512 [Tenebrio molitor]
MAASRHTLSGTTLEPTATHCTPSRQSLVYLDSHLGQVRSTASSRWSVVPVLLFLCVLCDIGAYRNLVSASSVFNNVVNSDRRSTTPRYMDVRLLSRCSHATIRGETSEWRTYA